MREEFAIAIAVGGVLAIYIPLLFLVLRHYRRKLRWARMAVLDHFGKRGESVEILRVQIGIPAIVIWEGGFPRRDPWCLISLNGQRKWVRVIRPFWGTNQSPIIKEYRTIWPI